MMHRAGLAHYEHVGSRAGIAWTYTNLGTVYRRRGHLDQAEAFYRKSLAIAEELRSSARTADNYSNLGIIHRLRGDFDRAERMYRRSLAIDEKLGRKFSQAENYRNLGSLQVSRGDFVAAEQLYRQSLELFERVGSADQAAATRELLATVTLVLGQESAPTISCRASGSWRPRRISMLRTHGRYEVFQHHQARRLQLAWRQAARGLRRDQHRAVQLR